MCLSVVFLVLFHVTVSIQRGGQACTYCRDQISAYQLVASFWPLRKHVKPQRRWFRLTHFIWKSSGEGEEETGNYSSGDNMGQHINLPGPLPSCVAVPGCLPRSWPYTNTPPLLTSPSSIFGTSWADPRQLFPAAQPMVLEMSNSWSVSEKLITVMVQKSNTLKGNHHATAASLPLAAVAGQQTRLLFQRC